MLSGLINKARDSAARTARQAALGAGGLLFILVGLGFLTMAAWLFLITVTTPMNAALILGGTYFGIGFILIGAGSYAGQQHRKVQEPELRTPAATPEQMVPQIVSAFLTGLAAGQKTRS